MPVRDPSERGGLTPADGDLTPPRAAVVERLARYDRLVEIGVGRRPGVAGALAARGCAVTATDVHERPVPAGVRFHRTDVVEVADRAVGGRTDDSGDAPPPDPGPLDTYRADAVYGLNLPPELHQPARDVARAVDADLLFTTLGGDEPAVPATPESLGSGRHDRETLYVATRHHRAGR